MAITRDLRRIGNPSADRFATLGYLGEEGKRPHLLFEAITSVLVFLPASPTAAEARRPIFPNTS